MRDRLLPEVLVEAIFEDERLTADETRAVLDAAANDPAMLRAVVEGLIRHVHATAPGLDAAVVDLAQNARVRGAYRGALAAHRARREHPAATTNPAPARKLAAADPRRPSTAFGELLAVEVRRPCGRKDRHAFADPPVLAHNEGGLLILGGRYRVTPRGLVG